MAADNGGPAFPVLPPLGPDGTGAVGYPYAWGGMTLRDYFVAHAPTEIPAWFRPQVPSLGPKPAIPTGLTQAEHMERIGYDEDVLRAEDIREPRVRKWAEDMDAWIKERDHHEALRLRERTLQWPNFWADEMLRRRFA